MSDIPETTETWVSYAVDVALSLLLYVTFAAVFVMAVTILGGAVFLGVAELVRR